MATHFSQESLLKSAYVLASKLQLPLVLHVSDPKSLDRALELLLEDSDNSHHEYHSNILIHDAFSCSGGEVHRLFADTHVHFLLSGAGLTDGDEATRQTARTFVKSLDLERIVIGTDGPWRTPQNLPDAYLRTVRNESANLPYVAQALSESLNMDRGEMELVIKANSLRLFGLEFIENHANIAMMPSAAASALNADKKNEDDDDDGAEEGEEDEEEELNQGHESHDALQEVTKELASADISSSSLPNPPKASHTPTPPIPPAQVHKKDSKKPIAAVSMSVYTCSKCRATLFNDSNILTHTLATTKKAVYKAGEEGLCTSFVFANVLNLIDPAKKTCTLEVVGSSVDCKQCGLKLGKYYQAEGVCSCGKTVPGPVAKLLASKLDCIDKTMDTQTLAQRAMLENSMLPTDEPVADTGDKKKIKKGKKHKSDNKGNFSNFRNKSFVPNASKVKRSGDDNADHEGAEGLDQEDGDDSEEEH